MATSEYIRLTPDQQSKNGAIWSRVVSSRPHIPTFLYRFEDVQTVYDNFQPVSFPWWEIQLSFKVHGSGKSVAADGMGLFLVKERTKQGSAIGGPERFQGMAILLDSYKNGGTTGNFPLVSGFHFIYISI